MYKTSKYFIILYFLLSVANWSCNQASGEKENVMDQIYWVAGEWKGRVKGGMMFENWKIAADSSIVGNSYILANGDTVFSETMHIVEKDGDVYYMVKVNKVTVPVAFKLVEWGPKGCVFENMEHDFPNRIVYANTIGDMLLARIEGVNNGVPDTTRFFMHRNKTFLEQ